MFVLDAFTLNALWSSLRPAFGEIPIYAFKQSKSLLQLNHLVFRQLHSELFVLRPSLIAHSFFPKQTGLCNQTN